jgi:hypothetical protein
LAGEKIIWPFGRFWPFLTQNVKNNCEKVHFWSKFGRFGLF